METLQQDLGATRLCTIGLETHIQQIHAMLESIHRGENDLPSLVFISLEKSKGSLRKDLAHTLRLSNFGRETWRLWCVFLTRCLFSL